MPSIARWGQLQAAGATPEQQRRRRLLQMQMQMQPQTQRRQATTGADDSRTAPNGHACQNAQPASVAILAAATAHAPTAIPAPAAAPPPIAAPAPAANSTAITPPVPAGFASENDSFSSTQVYVMGHPGSGSPVTERNSPSLPEHRAPRVIPPIGPRAPAGARLPAPLDPDPAPGEADDFPAIRRAVYALLSAERRDAQAARMHQRRMSTSPMGITPDSALREQLILADVPDVHQSQSRIDRLVVIRPTDDDVIVVESKPGGSKRTTTSIEAIYQVVSSDS
ncbi:hypothetical protein LPJ61_002501, partial [Coemansia biformis]